MRRFWKEENGAITLFLVIIILAVFMFNAVLIDSARIMAASKQTEHAVQAGVRSVLSNYNVKLLEYGLYGTDPKAAEEIFHKAVTLSLSPLEDEGGQYLELEEVENTLEVECLDSGMLSNVPVFEQQVLEEMKYKAALQILSELLQGNPENLEAMDVDIAEKLDESDQFMDISKELYSLQQSRDGILDDLYDDFQDIAKDIRRVAKSDIAASESETPRTDEEKEERREKLDKIQDDIDDALERLKQAEAKNNDMAALVEANRDLMVEYTNNHPDDTVLKDEFFDKYDAQLDKLDSLCSRSNLTQSSIDSIEKMLDEREELEAERKKPICTREQAEQEALNAAGKTEKFNTSEVDDIADSCLGDSDKIEKAYIALETTAKKYNAFTEERITFTKDNEAAAETAVKETKAGFKDGFLSLLIKSRDTFLVNEYAMMYYNCHTTDNKGEDRLCKLRKDHRIGYEEVEYITYGINSYGANFTAAAAEIYGIRLALHLIVGLKKFSKLVDPKAIIIAAATYAALMAADDERKLIGGGTVDLYPSLTKSKMPGSDLQISYQDYMRIFLLQANHDRKINRMQALMDLNTGIDLTHTPSYIQGTAQTKLKLWFLPGVMQALGKARDGYYYIDRNAAMYY